MCGSLQPQACVFLWGKRLKCKECINVIIIIESWIVQAFGEIQWMCGLCDACSAADIWASRNLFCGLIFMIFIFCLVWFISALPHFHPQLHTHVHTYTHTHAKESKRNKHICQRKDLTSKVGCQNNWEQWKIKLPRWQITFLPVIPEVLLKH